MFRWIGSLRLVFILIPQNRAIIFEILKYEFWNWKGRQRNLEEPHHISKSSEVTQNQKKKKEKMKMKKIRKMRKRILKSRQVFGWRPDGFRWNMCSEDDDDIGSVLIQSVKMNEKRQNQSVWKMDMSFRPSIIPGYRNKTISCDCVYFFSFPTLLKILFSRRIRVAK